MTLRYIGASRRPASQEQTTLNRLNRRSIHALIALSLALFAGILLAACGGSDGGSEDPQEVLDQTFSNEESIDSGVFEVALDVTAEGGENAGDLTATIGGPFQGGGGDGFPLFDIDAELDLNSEVQDFSGSAGLTSTGDKAFVNFQDSNYEVPAELFSQFSQNFLQLQEQNKDSSGEGGNFLSSVGINPANWLSDLSNEGNEDVEGTETIHISGTADVPKLVEDLKKIAENTAEAAEQLTPAQLGELDQLPDIVEEAKLDVFTGADDDQLRKLEATLTLNPPDAAGAPDTVDVNFAITLSALNDPQEIAAPSSVQPLGDLLEQFGIDENSLGELGAAQGGGGDGGASLPQAGGSPTPPSDSSSQAYLDCLKTAEGASALQQCASLLE